MDAPFVDSSLARERTRLAWSRYALSLIALAALGFRAALGRVGPMVACLLALLLTTVALAARAFAEAEYRRRGACESCLDASRRTLYAARMLTVGTTALGASALLLLLL